MSYQVPGRLDEMALSDLASCQEADVDYVA